MRSVHHIAGIGEALLDVVGDEQHLGGAPLNLVVHAHRLLSHHDSQCAIVSRIGQDATGDLLVEQLRATGVSDAFLQHDPDRPTGRAVATVDEQGEATFKILADAAWDHLQFDPELDDLAQQCDGVAFGTLAQRYGQTRNTIYRFLRECPQAVRLLDVNLRSGFDDARLLERSCQQATIVKMNRQELDTANRLLGLASITDMSDSGGLDTVAAALRKQFDLEMVVVTRGEAGTLAYTRQGRHEAAAAQYAPAADADSIGAGDACGAAVLVGRVLRLPIDRMLALANHAGAYVASQGGATPSLPESIIAMVGGG